MSSKEPGTGSVLSTWPGHYIDRKLVGRTFTPGGSQQLTVASFMAGSLRCIMLSPEFLFLPTSLQHKIRHLSFLMHMATKYENFQLILSHHCAILEDITSGVASWLEDEYLSRAEGNIMTSLEQDLATTRNQQGKEEICKKEFDESSYNCLDIMLDEEPDHVIVPNISSKPVKTKRAKRGAAKLSNMAASELSATVTVYCPPRKKDIKLEEGEDPLCKYTSQQQYVTYTCPHCSISKSSERWMQRHIDKVHGDEKEVSIACLTCSHVSSSFPEHVLHLRSHQSLVCTICGKLQPDLVRLRKHVRHHEEAQEEVCPYCGKVYKHIRAHIYTAHREHRLHKCALCEYTSTIPGAVNHHFRRVHNKPEVCSRCQKTVKDMKKHQRRGNCFPLAQEERRSYPCHICDKIFTQKHHLVRHVDNIHNKNRDYLCSQCTYKTTNNFNLKIHVRRVHEGKELKEECTFCGKYVYNEEYHVKAYHQEEIFASLGLRLQETSSSSTTIAEVQPQLEQEAAPVSPKVVQ